MEILQLNFSDSRGGAARAAYRLHKGLRASGVRSRMMVQFKAGGDPDVVVPEGKVGKGLVLARDTIEPLVSNFRCGGVGAEFSAAWLPFSMIASRVDRYLPDVIQLHWVNGGMLRIEDIPKLKKPLIWTLHDMWAFTGGCHYNDACERYQRHCGECPLLHNRGENDLSSKVFGRKKKAWCDIDIVVAPSRWMAECAKRSSLFHEHRIEVIPNGVDLGVYKPLNKLLSREAWNLPVDKKLILFGAVNAQEDRRKGLDLLYEAIRRMNERWSNHAELVVFGTGDREGMTGLPLPVHYVGNVHDDVSLALLYSAADVMVVSSRQDNLPNTAIESHACGTPVVAFDVGGIKDIVTHQQNGYLAQPYDSTELAYWIETALADADTSARMSEGARNNAVKCFDIRETAQRYMALYESLLK